MQPHLRLDRTPAVPYRRAVTNLPRTRFIEHKDRKIVLMDFSHIIDEATGEAAIAEAKRFVAAQPRVRNLLTMVDATGARATAPLIEQLRDLAAHNTPWVLAGSVVGVNPILSLLLRIITSVTGRKLAAFRTRDDAKEWLVKQQVPPTTVPQEWTEAI
jgi:hypothetical protein